VIGWVLPAVALGLIDRSYDDIREWETDPATGALGCTPAELKLSLQGHRVGVPAYEHSAARSSASTRERADIRLP
jgi:hypothetical protein